MIKRKKYWVITYATPKNQTLTTTPVAGDFIDVLLGVMALEGNIMFAQQITKKEAKKWVAKTASHDHAT